MNEFDGQIIFYGVLFAAFLGCIYLNRFYTGRVLVLSFYWPWRLISIAIVGYALYLSWEMGDDFLVDGRGMITVVMFATMAVFTWFCGGNFWVYGASRRDVEDAVRASLERRGKSLKGVLVRQHFNQIRVSAQPLWTSSVLGAIAPEVKRALKHN